MPTVEVARHLHRFFPALATGPRQVEAATAAEVVQALDQELPGFADYIVDERGALRIHVNMFIGEAKVLDRKALSDRVAPDATVYIFQALSGG